MQFLTRIVCVYDQSGQKRPEQINPRRDGTHDVVYYPEVEGPCQVNVMYEGKPVNGRFVYLVTFSLAVIF